MSGVNGSRVRERPRSVFGFERLPNPPPISHAAMVSSAGDPAGSYDASAVAASLETWDQKTILHEAPQERGLNVSPFNR